MSAVPTARRNQEYFRDSRDTADPDPELDITVRVAALVCDLASLADPAARELIRTAFAEDLVGSLFPQ